MIAGAKLDYKKAPAEENADRGMIRGKWECFGECFFSSGFFQQIHQLDSYYNLPAHRLFGPVQEGGP